jgi:hypothetical protein
MAACHQVPIIGNGDLLTHYEAEERAAARGCHAHMVARGALIKPWIFQVGGGGGGGGLGPGWLAGLGPGLPGCLAG